MQALTAGEDYAGAANAAIQAADLASELEERELEIRLRLGAGHSLRLLKRFPDAAGAYEQAITVIDGLPDASDWQTQALEGLGAVLRDSPQTGAARLRRLAERYAGADDQRLEALCRHELALCLERIRPAQHAEFAAEYTRAARLFDQVGDASRAGDCWYRAASAYNWLGLLHPEYREMCYEACGVAADRFEAAGNLAGKGLAEFMAGQALRKDDPAAAQDPRNLPVLRRSVRSFVRAGWTAAETGSRLAVTLELAQVGTYDAWMASALLALRSYEAARAGLLIPQHRQRNDTQVIRGLQILGSHLWRASASKGSTRRWTELAWRLEQAAKGRSFLDQHHQDEVWNSLVASDDIMRELTRKIEYLALRRDDLTRVIDAALVAGQVGGKIRKKADLRNTISADLEQTQRQLDLRVEEVVRERPDQAGLASVPPVTPGELQACLSPREAYLGYLWNGGSVIRALVTRSMVRIQAADSGLVTMSGVRSPWPGTVRLRPMLARRLSQACWPDSGRYRDPHHLPGRSAERTPLALLPLPGPADPATTSGTGTVLQSYLPPGSSPRLRANHGGAVEPDATYLGVACDGAGAGARLACVDGEVEAVARGYFSADPAPIRVSHHRQLPSGPTRGRVLCAPASPRLPRRPERFLLSRDGTWVTPVDLVGRGLRAGILLLMDAVRGTSPDRTTTSSSAWSGS